MIGLHFLLFIATMATASTALNNTLATTLFQAIATERSAENVIFSPISIETSLALAYLGAEGRTAEELAKILRQRDANDKKSIARKFEKLFENTKSLSSSATFRLANSIYVDQRYELSTQYNELAVSQLRANAENVHFAEAAATAERINNWVEAQTEHKIQHLLSANSLDENTAVVLVNALYFKAKWLHQFNNRTTMKRDFTLSATRTVPVDMMKQKDTFLYGVFEDLDATAVEMGYLDTDVSMLIILPRSVDGLAALEEKLKDVDLTQLSAAMRTEEVVLQLPKFKFEFDLSLKPVLEQLGATTMFSAEADFSGLLAKREAVAINEAKHKAFIEVNESGTEAAAATYLKIVPLSASFTERIYQFNADHPFVFVIKDKENVYFIGHVTHF